ncbi:MAG: hypothetical protein EP343_28185 [Deltaproteobacteria bacterium]|nr:MAG: hypothetical protein EP343_28185 [Deltaproteobacteria bacterium]
MNRSLVLFLTVLLFFAVAQPWSCSPPEVSNGETTGTPTENDTQKESSGEEKTAGTSKEATVEEPSKAEQASDEKATGSSENVTSTETSPTEPTTSQEPTSAESQPMGPEPAQEPTGTDSQEPAQRPEPAVEPAQEPPPQADEEPAQQEPPTPGPEPVFDAGTDSESATPEPPQDNSVTDAGSPPESTIPEWVNGQPVQAPAKKWTWVDVQGSKCGYGTQTGFGINLKPGAKRAFIFLQGGGGCWTRYNVIGSCFKLVNSSLYLTGFNKSVFAVDAFTLVTLNSFFFKRVKANVFQNDHYVFIPYCTGDVHAGNGTMKSLLGRTMYFHGHKNMKLFLAQIVPTLKGVKEVYIAGSSAGGFGAALNWGLVQQAFGNNVKVHLINDSGPPMEPGKGRWDTWVKAWNMAMPPGCPNNCKTDISAIIDHYKKTLMKQGRKMAFLSYDKDAIINTFFGYGDPLGNTFKKGIDGLIKVMDTIFNAEYFILSGRSHTMLLVGPENIKDSKTQVTLPQWIEWMVKDDPSWKGIKP